MFTVGTVTVYIRERSATSDVSVLVKKKGGRKEKQ